MTHKSNYCRSSEEIITASSSFVTRKIRKLLHPITKKKTFYVGCEKSRNRMDKTIIRRPGRRKDYSCVGSDRGQCKTGAAFTGVELWFKKEAIPTHRTQPYWRPGIPAAHHPWYFRLSQRWFWRREGVFVKYVPPPFCTRTNDESGVTFRNVRIAWHVSL